MASEVLLQIPSTTGVVFHKNVVQKRTPINMLDVARIPPIQSESKITPTYATISKDPLAKIVQLENTIKFLKEEQTSMLNNLHEEIASLQAKNRDLLFRFIFKKDEDKNVNVRELVNVEDVKFILTRNEAVQKDKKVNYEDKNNVHQLKYTIEQQNTEIEYLKEQLRLMSIQSKSHGHESRRVDQYIQDIEDKGREQEKIARQLKKENKDYKNEIENLRNIISNTRVNNQLSQNMQITHVQPQTQLFPAIPNSTSFWYQNRSLQLSDYNQLQRNGINSDRSTNNIPHVQYTLPPICSYRQIPVTAPPQRYYNAGGAAGCYYSIAQRPVLRNKSYSTENCIRPNHLG